VPHMAKSFRLDADLERRLEAAAAREGVPESALIRDAVRRRCDEVLGRSLFDDLGDTIGALDGEGDDMSLRTGRAFTELLLRKDRDKRRL
jgi:predicted DNA-binding protein